MDIFSETDQQQYLIDISNEEGQINDTQDDFKDTFLRNSWASLNTLLDLCKSDFPEDGEFNNGFSKFHSLG